MGRNFLRFVYYYLPALLWAAVIFYFSSVPGLKVGLESVSGEIIWRKIGHSAEFMVLAWLVWRILYYYHELSLKKSLVISFIVVSAYSVSDEIHQSFTPERAGKLIDVAFDVVSAFLALDIMAAIASKKIRAKYLVFGALAILLLVAMDYQMILEGNRFEQAKRQQSAGNTDTRQTGDNQSELGQVVIDDEPSLLDKLKGTEDESAEGALPRRVMIPVPFTSQAPDANWDEYHEEACEEASLIMVKYYLDGKKLNRDMAEKEIQKIIAYQIDHYGDYKDSSAQELVRLAKEFYGLENLRVVYDFQPEEIKKYLAQGNPIIIPAAGRRLGNPNFTAPGPLYHNLVLIGYDGDTIITNDPGTRKGEGYKYSLRTIYDAIHDFTGDKEKIEQGRKAMIVIDEK